MEKLKLQTPLELLGKKTEWFQRVLKNKSVAEHLKEAKRVKYLVKKDDLEFQIHDDVTGDIVMNGMRLNAAFWITVFSKKYWVEPINRDYRADQLEGMTT
jgi:hypothetical protein